jgi:hypothetical protein
VASTRFWKPIWDFIQLDVLTIRAAEAFMANPRREPSGPADLVDCYASLLATEAEIETARRLPGLSPSLGDLLRNYHSLGQDHDCFRGVHDELAALSDADLLALMRVFFAHPIWSVGEAAGTALSSLIEQDPKRRPARLAIVSALFDHKNWRVRFSANEAAFAVRHLDKRTQEDVFYASVRRFYKDENCKIRGLCAENLFSHILNSGSNPRKLLKAFEDQILYWLNDEDCWVLEHVYRLFNRLDQKTVDDLLPAQVSPLLEGEPQWYRMEREAFLLHIEERKEARVPAPA